jgi:hypothetical protein
MLNQSLSPYGVEAFFFDFAGKEEKNMLPGLKGR